MHIDTLSQNTLVDGCTFINYMESSEVVLFALNDKNKIHRFTIKNK